MSCLTSLDFSFGREINNLRSISWRTTTSNCWLQKEDLARLVKGTPLAVVAVAVVVPLSYQSVKIRVNKLPRIRADESEEGNWTASTQSGRAGRKCLYLIP